MTIDMGGSSLVSTLGKRVLGKNVREIFTLRRPKAEFTWQSLMTRKVVFELLSKIPVIRKNPRKQKDQQKTSHQALKRTTSTNDFKSSSTQKPGSQISNHSVPPQSSITQDSPPTLHLRGQMKYIKSWDKILYICSPLIGSLDAMLDTGLYMNDFSMHDTSQEMVLSGIKPLPQLEYARDQQFEQGRELEQTMEKLNNERQKSEELLYRMIPKEIADRLRQGESPISTCEYFDSVTVMFSYMDGFASICARVSPMKAVTLINNVFTLFDRLTERHNVYKFETLGDALYMVVSGAPKRQDHHAEPMAAMALDMLNTVQKVKDPITKKAMTVTIGIHTGPVAAGLVGEMTLQYCLFGDTVNIASRLRTTALPMRIHISEQCNEALKGSKFQVEFRGVIEVKGKGKMKTFWLIR
ncbi:soluble guanylate cyclase 88E [Exaiptasia diaphana]|uniref:guanylate cyclase n=1 Tax=Exaiptasia diaphana TaxID=2652724 RepID=A0A913XSL0_EXADI|nr:soluble guanylate cyclase 88E [Exaiptasia diaphana]